VHVEAGVCGESVLDYVGLVDGVVVGDQVHLGVGGHLLIDRVEERAELGGAVPAVQ